MIIADTSVWIEFLKGDEDISILFAPYLRKGHIYTVSAIFGELFQGAKNQRERAVLNEFWEYLPKVEEEDLFIKAGKLSNQYKFYAKGVGLIDCYILSAALEQNMALWTLDKKRMEAMDHVDGDSF